MKLLELNVKVTDKASELAGMLTHAQVGSDFQTYYLFQPKGIDPETGTPVKSIWISQDRVKGGNEIDVDIPVEMLGSFVTDKASGFCGTVTHLTLHTTGCVHALVQAKGALKKNGHAIDPCDFDLRRLEGNKVPKFTEPELKKSIKEKPSPSEVTPYTPRM